MKIIQIISDGSDSITALTDDGRVFAGYWNLKGFEWYSEITPDELKLQNLPIISVYSSDEEKAK